MVDEIRVNDYVRTKDGNIAQITKIRKYTDRKLIETDSIGAFGYEYLRKQVVKHSQNLIDLIECEDYVNGKEVIMDLKKSKEWYKSNDNFITCKDYTFGENEIQTIVTKEQIKAIEYRVKG